MFSILFSCETSNQSAVDDCASVADWVVYGGDTANCYVCEPKYFMKQVGTSMAKSDVPRRELPVAGDCYCLS
jgi:ferredoxin-NADP reductase